ncbi:hypothetical protein [Gemmobacter denitrificans]|uniref:Capsular polysaccharide biosynthesis protein n=1 Tax=Gemmobacter denitrificans TaxID=3123040 RepID=A0ABU8BUI7_9RHOB
MAPRLLDLHLPAHLRADHQAGKVNILSRLIEALPGWQITDRDEHAPERAHPGHSLLHMREPVGPRTLSLRRAYLYPFWRIEPTNERWNFAVAQARPALAGIAPGPARGFHRRLRDRCFPGLPDLTDEGFIFMLLQGRLLDHRSFQSMSPVAMIEATLACDPRPICATLHPGESYSAAEHAALAALQDRHPRFRLVEGRAADLVPRCSFVVTQNSSVGLQAMIAGKGLVLFAGIDFHHPAGSVGRDGLAAAFDKGRIPSADMARWLWWFFKDQAIDAQSPEAASRIARLLAAQGWPVE